MQLVSTNSQCIQYICYGLFGLLHALHGHHCVLFGLGMQTFNQSHVVKKKLELETYISTKFSILSQQIQDPDGIIVLLLIAVFIAMSILFLYCYCGKFATERFQKMCDCVYELNWQKLPLNQQKYIVLMISNMQRPLYYHGIGIVTLDLSAFVQVSYRF